MKLRLTIAGIALFFALYTAYEAYQIAHAGAVLGIAQLAGDGGGGLVYTLISALAAITLLRFARIGGSLFLVAALCAVWVGLLYEDHALFWWAAVSVVLAAASFWMAARARTLAGAQKRDNDRLHPLSR